MPRKNHRKTPLWLITLTFSYGVILAAITVLNWFGPDRWWFGAFNFYLPQAMWLIPGVLLTLISLKVARHFTWIPGLCVVWVFGPIMGLCWSLHGPFEKPDGVPAIRVMTCNAKYGMHNIFALMDDIDSFKPDIVLLQDSVGSLRGPLRDFFSKWEVRSFGQYVIASRFPLGKGEVRSISFLGEKQECLRCQLHFDKTVITLYNVHFETPREGLNAFRAARRHPWYLPQAIIRLENNVEDRLTQAYAIREYVRQERDPVIVAGDLNSPDPSLVCATLRDAGLHDAFAEGGTGFGYTYGHFLLRHRLPWFRLSWMRIDHIMVSSQLQSRRCWTGTGKASDHRPVIADLILKRP